MLLEASRQHKLVIYNTSDRELANARYANKAIIPGAKCEHCGSMKHSSERYWPKFPHLALEWYQLKLKYDKEKKDGKHTANLALRDDDFVDSTHYSC